MICQTNINAWLMSLTTLISFSAQAFQVCDSNIQPTTPSQVLVRLSDNTIKDTRTGLIWQACLVGQTPENCDGEASTLNWAEALEHAASVNKVSSQTGWRLPNIRELASIVELQCSRPAVNLVEFKNQAVGHVWSSSPYKFYDHYAWFLDFEDGIYGYGDRTDKKMVRLVRE